MALSDNLLAYYSLGEASGDAADAHGSLTYTANNAPGAGTGKVGGSRTFNGTDQYFSRTSNPLNGKSALSIAAWVRYTESSAAFANPAIFHTYDGANGDGVRLELNGEDIAAKIRLRRAEAYTESSAVADSGISLNTWIFVVGTIAADGTVRLYIDGSIQATTGSTSGTVGNSNDSYIGWNESVSYWKGDIDELALWDRELSAAEVTELYNSGSGRDYAYVTGGGGDVTAPTLTSPTGTATSDTAADLSVSTDEGNGTLYWVVTQSSTSPSAAQVKAGQDHAGAAADDSGSQAVSGTGVQNVSGGATGLAAATVYYAHFMHEDAATNQSAVATSSSFTTDSSPPDTDPPTAGSWAAPSAGTTITATLSESGCVADGGGTSGTGGFTLTGTPATVSGWSISGTALTLTLTNLVYQGEVVTVAYSRASTTDDIKDAAGNYLADFGATSVTNNSTQTGGGAGGSVFGNGVFA